MLIRFTDRELTKLHKLVEGFNKRSMSFSYKFTGNRLTALLVRLEAAENVVKDEIRRNGIRSYCKLGERRQERNDLSYVQRYRICNL